MSDLIPINPDGQGSLVISTLDFAAGLNIQHASLIKTVRDYQSAIEKDFGPLRFEIDADYQRVTGIVRMSHAYLTEDQALFVGSLSRNSERVVEFKSVLVRSFAEARKRQQVSVSLPQSYKEALQALLVEVEEKERLQLENAELKPKAAYVDLVLTSQSELTTTLIAKELSMSAVALNRKLQQLRIQYKQGGVWVLYQPYQDKQFARLRTHTYAGSDGKIRTTHYLVWTEMGRKFIHERINNGFGPAPSIFTGATA